MIAGEDGGGASVVGGGKTTGGWGGDGETAIGEGDAGSGDGGAGGRSGSAVRKEGHRRAGSTALVIARARQAVAVMSHTGPAERARRAGANKEIGYNLKLLAARCVLLYLARSKAGFFHARLTRESRTGMDRRQRRTSGVEAQSLRTAAAACMHVRAAVGRRVRQQVGRPIQAGHDHSERGYQQQQVQASKQHIQPQAGMHRKQICEKPACRDAYGQACAPCRAGLRPPSTRLSLAKLSAG